MLCDGKVPLRGRVFHQALFVSALALLIGFSPSAQAQEKSGPSALENAELLTVPEVAAEPAVEVAPQKAEPEKKPEKKKKKKKAKAEPAPNPNLANTTMMGTPIENGMPTVTIAPKGDEPVASESEPKVVSAPGASLEVVADYPDNDKVTAPLKKKNFARPQVVKIEPVEPKVVEAPVVAAPQVVKETTVKVEETTVAVSAPEPVKKKNFAQKQVAPNIVETKGIETKVVETGTQEHEGSVVGRMLDDLFGIESKPAAESRTVESSLAPKSVTVEATTTPMAAPTATKAVDGIFLKPETVVVRSPAPTPPASVPAPVKVVQPAPAAVTVAEPKVVIPPPPPPPPAQPVVLAPIHVSPPGVIVSQTPPQPAPPPQTAPVRLEMVPPSSPPPPPEPVKVVETKRIVEETKTVVVSPPPAPAPAKKADNDVGALKQNVDNVLDDVFGIEVKKTSKPAPAEPAKTTVVVSSATEAPLAPETAEAAPKTAHWKAARGQTLREVLQGWCNEAGVQLYWNTNYDFPLQTGVDIENTFEGAVGTILSGFELAAPRPYGRLFRQKSVAQNVLIIETRQEKK